MPRLPILLQAMDSSHTWLQIALGKNFRGLAWRKEGKRDIDFRKKGQLPRERRFGHLRERRHQEDVSFEKEKREESRVF